MTETAGQPPMGLLQLTLQGNRMKSSLITPRVRINGGLVAASYGLNSIPVYAGPTHVEIDMPWLWIVGQAEIDVDVAPGRAVPLFYASPRHQFSRGALGTVKQKRPGGAIRVIRLVILAALVLLAVGAILGLL